MSIPGSAVIDGVDVDALAAAVRSCSGVADLDRGVLGDVASYLPGRRLTGIRVRSDRVTLQVKGMWGVPVTELAAQIEQAAAPFVGHHTVDIVVTDLTDPTPARDAPITRDDRKLWTMPNAAAAPHAESSSARTIPTEGARPPNS